LSSRRRPRLYRRTWLDDLPFPQLPSDRIQAARAASQSLSGLGVQEGSFRLLDEALVVCPGRCSVSLYLLRFLLIQTGEIFLGTAPRPYQFIEFGLNGLGVAVL
jgi:hypothetical protein